MRYPILSDIRDDLAHNSPYSLHPVLSNLLRAQTFIERKDHVYPIAFPCIGDHTAWYRTAHLFAERHSEILLCHLPVLHASRTRMARTFDVLVPTCSRLMAITVEWFRTYLLWYPLSPG